MIIMCSSMVKLLSTHVIESVLPTIIDAVGIEPVLQAEEKLKEKAAQGAQAYHATSQESLEDPCDCLCSFIEGVVTQIKEAIKQALLQFISVETPTQSPKLAIADPGQQTSDVTDGLTSLYTKAIILELIQLSCPGISHLVPKGKKPDQPVSFYRVIRSIMKAMRHTEDIQGCPSTSDDKESTTSGGSEKTIYDEKFIKKAVLAISGILREAKDQVISAGFSCPCLGPLGEIAITESAVRLWPTASQITEKFLKGLKMHSDQTNPDSRKLLPSRNDFFPAACETYKCVQKEVMSFLFKVQKSAESNCQVSGNSDVSSSTHSSEHGNPSMRNVLKGSSTSLDEKELLHIDKCTDQVICKILSVYRTQNQELSSDRWRSACSQAVCDLLIRNVQILHPGKTKRTSHRRLSRSLIKYLESAALNIAQSFSRDLEDRLEAASGDETQNGYSSLNYKSALDYTNILAPFHLFRNVRDQIRNVFSTVNAADLSVRTTEKSMEEDDVLKSSPDHEGFSHGYAQRQFRRPSSAINQLKFMLSSTGTTPLTNSISTLLSSMIGAISILRRFSHLIQKKAAPISSARNISMLVDNVALEFIKHLAGYFMSTVSTFSHLPVQTETLSCFNGKLKTDSGQEIIVALWDLTNSLSCFVTEFMKAVATPTKRTRSQEGQSSAMDNECPGPRLHPPVGKKKKRRRPAIHSSKRSTNPSGPAGHQKIYSFNGVNGNKGSSVETLGCYLCRNFSAFFRVLRKRFKR
ncbi:uncharacterized protein Hap1MRO34_025758 [Clarias gariepinus]